MEKTNIYIISKYSSAYAPLLSLFFLFLWCRLSLRVSGAPLLFFVDLGVGRFS